MDLAIEVLGWTGAVLVLAAYLLAARGAWPASGAKGATVNVIGGGLLVVNAWAHGAFPSVGLNLAWLGIGVATILGRSGQAEPADA